MKPVSLDFSAYDVSQHKDEVGKSGIAWPFSRLAQAVSINVLFLIMLAPLSLVGVYSAFDSEIDTTPEVIVAMLTLTNMVFWVGIAFTKAHVQQKIAAVRMQAFAAANNFTYTQKRKDPQLKGMLFQNGSDRHSFTVVEGEHAGFQFELGNFKYLGRRNEVKSRQHQYGYMSISLPRHLPHMVLDSRHDSYFGETSLPNDISASQKLQLEGNFGTYFDLYCPKNYERDALYVFTPELMALLIDYGNKFDMELADDRLLVYGYGGFDFTKKTQLEQLFALIDVVAKGFQKRTERYADSSVGDTAIDIVATPGRRLSRGYRALLLSIGLPLLVYLFYFFVWHSA